MSLVRYLLVGLANTLVGYSIIYLSMYFLGLGTVAANGLGYGIGMLFGFALNKKWTFRSEGQLLWSLIKYLGVLAVAYAANLATVLFVQNELHANPYLAQAFGVIPYTAIGYLGSRFLAFRTRRDTDTQNLYQSTRPLHLLKPGEKRAFELSIVVPCYNEEEALPETVTRLAALRQYLIDSGKITPASSIYFVDDGSRDGTWNLIETLAHTHDCVRGIRLSRNRGHQNALLAGLFSAAGAAIVSVDADLQDDLQAIEQMVDLHASGYDIVYGVRKSRDSDSFFKRVTAETYYRLLKMMGVEIVFNHADFRLMSRASIDALRDFGESNLFLRGIIPQIGFSFGLVFYDRAERFAGESKYPLRKMLSLAWQGITSFSTVPLRFITVMGLLVFLGSLALTAWALFIRMFTNEAVPGWTSIVLPIYTLGGIQLLCLGIMGEYMAKIYSESKRRPRYIIEKMI